MSLSEPEQHIIQDVVAGNIRALRIESHGGLSIEEMEDRLIELQNKITSQIIHGITHHRNTYQKS